jgi:hypothetical protein
MKHGLGGLAKLVARRRVIDPAIQGNGDDAHGIAYQSPLFAIV